MNYKVGMILKQVKRGNLTDRGWKKDVEFVITDVSDSGVRFDTSGLEGMIGFGNYTRKYLDDNFEVTNKKPTRVLVEKYDVYDNLHINTSIIRTSNFNFYNTYDAENFIDAVKKCAGIITVKITGVKNDV